MCHQRRQLRAYSPILLSTYLPRYTDRPSQPNQHHPLPTRIKTISITSSSHSPQSHLPPSPSTSRPRKPQSPIIFYLYLHLTITNLLPFTYLPHSNLLTLPLPCYSVFSPLSFSNFYFCVKILYKKFAIFQKKFKKKLSLFRFL